MRADRDEDRIEAARHRCSARTSSTLWLRTIRTPMSSIRADLLHQIVARQAIGGDAEVHHAAGQPARPRGSRRHGRAGRGDRRRRGRSARRRRRGRACRSAARRSAAASLLDAARSPRKRSTAWMLTAAVERHHDCSALFAGVVADAAVHRRQRVVAHQRLPGLRGICPPGQGRARLGCSPPAGQASLQGGSRST